MASATWAEVRARRLARCSLAERAPADRLVDVVRELGGGRRQGPRVTFARPDQWIDGWHDVDERDALLDACRRYLHTYGPARPGDFREWFARGLTAGDASALFESLAEELEEIDVEG